MYSFRSRRPLWAAFEANKFVVKKNAPQGGRITLGAIPKSWQELNCLVFWQDNRIDWIF